jgi:hypothetical protein
MQAPSGYGDSIHQQARYSSAGTHKTTTLNAATQRSCRKGSVSEAPRVL